EQVLGPARLTCLMTRPRCPGGAWRGHLYVISPHRERQLTGPILRLRCGRDDRGREGAGRVRPPDPFGQVTTLESWGRACYIREQDERHYHLLGRDAAVIAILRHPVADMLLPGDNDLCLLAQTAHATALYQHFPWSWRIIRRPPALSSIRKRCTRAIAMP